MHQQNAPNITPRVHLNVFLLLIFYKLINFIYAVLEIKLRQNFFCLWTVTLVVTVLFYQIYNFSFPSFSL
jgi:hypothetical protein